MKTTMTLTLLILSLTGLFSQEIADTWRGILRIQEVELEIVFHIKKQGSNYISSMDSPTQGAFDIPTTSTKFKNDHLEIVIKNLGAFYQGKLQEDTIKGVFNQGGMPLKLHLTRSEKDKKIRPQEPSKPYPYKTEEVVFYNKKEKIDLAGTLTLPNTEGKHPVVILIAGSGPNDRDETVFAHKPFWILADHLTRENIAVLRYDKRGIGQSKGSYFTATTKDFAEDVEAAISYLKTRDDIDINKIGLIGHSEGGIIAPMVAAKDNNIKFIVLMAGLGVNGTELILQQSEHSFNNTSLTTEEITKLKNILLNIYSKVSNRSEYRGTDEERNQLKEELTILWQNLSPEMRAKTSKKAFINSNINNITSPWFSYFLSIDPLQYLKKLSTPVLAINGENDTQVEYKSNLAGIEKALKEANNKNYTIKSYPKLNHLFQESVTGEVDEYVQIEQTISPIVLNEISSWIKNQIE